MERADRAVERGRIAEWTKLATTRTVVHRATTTAVIVGAFLIAINQGDVILRHDDLPPSQWLRMVLTVMVPYLVSTVSSVQAMRVSSGRPTEPPAPR